MRISSRYLPAAVLLYLTAAIGLAAPTVTPESGFTLTFLQYGPSRTTVTTTDGTYDNIALSATGSIGLASSVYNNGGNANHQIDHLGDGSHGNSQSWLDDIANGSADNAGIDLAGDGVCTAHSFAFGRDNTGTYTDRSVGTYKIYHTLVTADISNGTAPPTGPNSRLSITGDAETGWQLVGTIQVVNEANHALRRLFSLGALRMTGLMIESPNGNCIDEIEIYGEAPKVMASEATNITASSATLNGSLLETNGPTYVWAAWGTADGTTNKPGMPGAWQNWQQYGGGTAQPTGALAHAISGLKADTKYYFRFYASNSTWDAWSDTEALDTSFSSSGYAWKMKIRFSGYDPPGAPDDTLTNFPALVVLYDGIGGSDFSTDGFKTATGNDLRFTSSNGVDVIPHEIDGTWTNGGTNYVWVNVPELSGTNTYVWAYYGKAGASLPEYTGDGSTWNSLYGGVWHMSEVNPVSSTSARDTGAGDTSTTNGIIRDAQKYDQSNTESTTFQGNFGFGTASVTMGCWVYRNNNENGAYVTIGDDDDGYSYGAGSTTPRLHQAGNRLAGLYEQVAWLNTGYNLSTGWLHVQMRINSSEQADFFVNGSKVAGPLGSGPNAPAKQAAFGVGYAEGRYLEGILDEIRVSSTARSDDWIWAEHMNMASNTVFNQYHAIESVPQRGTLYRFR